MECRECNSRLKKHGKDRHGNQRFRCVKCGKTILESRKKLFGKMNIEEEKGISCLRLLTEGNYIRSTERLTGVHRATILKLLALVGSRLEKFSESMIVSVPVQDVECDEVWTFVQSKEKTKKRKAKQIYTEGDAYTFTAIERNTKMILAWHLGKRTSLDTYRFTQKLDRATSGHFQVTTDGFAPYRDAISFTLGAKVSFAQLIKVFKQPREGEQRYSPSEISGVVPVVVYGSPDEKKICTSHVERHNLDMRSRMKRFTRLTNGHSRKWKMLHASLALHFAFYNFCRVHSSIKVTPAMEAGITDHIWDFRELLERAAEL